MVRVNHGAILYCGARRPATRTTRTASTRDGRFHRTSGRRRDGSRCPRLEDVEGEGRSLVIDGTHPGFAFLRLSFERAALLAVDAGLMTADDAETVGVRLAEGSRRLMTPTLVAAVGRAPLDAA
jgi:hypothetical protein